jgi:uncharacterized membrane protein
MTSLSSDQPQTINDVAPQPMVDSGAAPQAREINVGWNERRLSLLGGTGLLLLGLTRGTFGGLGLAALGGMLAHRGVTGQCRVYSALKRNTALDDPGPEPDEYFDRGIHVESSYTIDRPAEELYRFWRDFQNLPRFMSHLKSVQVLDDKKSRWVAKAPAGLSVQWDAQIINEEPNSLIAWKSIGGSDVDNAGSVRFLPAPGGRGTEVRVVVDYIPPAGKVGSILARLFGENPQQQIEEDLRHFKQLMEAGEIPTTEGQPRGSCQQRMFA